MSRSSIAAVCALIPSGSAVPWQAREDAAAAETGWFTDATSVVVVRIEDNRHARQLEFR